jgi:hypothetical protein
MLGVWISHTQDTILPKDRNKDRTQRSLVTSCSTIINESTIKVTATATKIPQYCWNQYQRQEKTSEERGEDAERER